MTYTVDVACKIGKYQYRAGTFTDAHDSGDSIVTGLNKVLTCGANANATALAIGIKESSTAGTLTIYGETGADTDDGYWFAIGK